MNNRKKFKTAFIILSVIFIIAGLFLILNPQISEKVMGIIVGAIFIVYGLTKLIGFIFNIGIKSESFFTFISALLNVGVGMFVIYNHGKVLSITAVIIGIIVCFESIMRIMTSFEVKQTGYEKWHYSLISGIISLAVSAVIILNPFKSALAVYVILGIALLVNGIFRLWNVFTVSKIIEILEPIETTATVSDADDNSDKISVSDDSSQNK